MRMSRRMALYCGLGGGMPLSDLPVGALVSMNVNGAAKNFMVVHQGKPSGIYDASCDGTWLLMKDIYENRQWHSVNVNDYANSTIHSYLNNTFLNYFDSSIRTLIKQVKIPYRKGSSGSTVSSGVNGLSAKVFLLGAYEVGWSNSTNSKMPTDGACLTYFNGLSTLDSRRIAYLNGTATIWWLRSPDISSEVRAWYVKADGDYSRNGTRYENGIRPAFILPPNAVVNPTPNADGSYTLLA